MHRELLQNPCKAESEDAVHLKSKIKRICTTCVVNSVEFLCLYKRVAHDFYFLFEVNFYSTNRTAVKDQIMQMQNYIFRKALLLC